MRSSSSVTFHPMTHGELYGRRVERTPLFVLDGSFYTSPVDHSEVLLQQLTAITLTSGTRRRDADEFADMLERRGAMLSISSENRRVAFSAKACAEDLSMVSELLVECLAEPRFDAAELERDQERMIAELQYRAMFPRVIASEALTRLLYSSSDIRYCDEASARAAQIERFGISEVVRYYRQQFGANRLRIAAVGNVDVGSLACALDEGLSAWCETPVGDPFTCTRTQPSAGSARIEVPGERYAVALGLRLELGCDHPDYAPVWLANQILGGSFTSRLVRSVRDERGLTYSIGSQLVQPDPELAGHWLVEFSSSPDKLDAGRDAVRSELDRFARQGIASDELDARKGEAIGEFQVGLSSLSGMSEAILAGAEQGHGLDHLQAFPDRIRAITLDDVNRVIRQHLRHDALCEVVAGPG